MRHLELAASGTTVVDATMAGRAAASAARMERDEFWPGAHLGLTQRESEVLALLVAGRSNRAIAGQLVHRRRDGQEPRALAAAQAAGRRPHRGGRGGAAGGRVPVTTRGPRVSTTRSARTRSCSRIIEATTSGPGVEPLAAAVARVITEATATDVCFVHVLDDTERSLTLAGATPPFDAQVGRVRLPLDTGVTGWVASHREPAVITGDKHADPRYVAIPELHGEQYTSMVSVPMESEPAGLAGVLNVHTRRAPRVRRPRRARAAGHRQPARRRAAPGADAPPARGARGGARAVRRADGGRAGGRAAAPGPRHPRRHLPAPGDAVVPPRRRAHVPRPRRGRGGPRGPHHRVRPRPHHARRGPRRDRGAAPAGARRPRAGRRARGAGPRAARRARRPRPRGAPPARARRGRALPDRPGDAAERAQARRRAGGHGAPGDRSTGVRLELADDGVGFDVADRAGRDRLRPRVGARARRARRRLRPRHLAAGDGHDGDRHRTRRLFAERRSVGRTTLDCPSQRSRPRSGHGRPMECGCHPLRGDGLLAARLRTQGHRHPVRVPRHAAGGGAAGGGGRRRRRRVEHRHVDRGVDRPPHDLRALPGEVLPGRRRPRRRGPVDRLHRLRPRPVRGGVDREPDQLDHRQRLRLQAAQGAAPRGHAHPDALRQDVPGPAARDRPGAGVPQQVRPPAARRHHEAQARALVAQLRPRRLRGPARRPGLHQGRREHQLAAVHALAGPLPGLHGGGEQGPGRDRRGEGPLPQHHRRRHGGHVRAGRVRPRPRQRHRHARPDRRLHGDPVDVEVGARATA